MRSIANGAIWSSGRRWLWAGSFGLAAVSGTAYGQDCVTSGCEPLTYPGADCQQFAAGDDGCTTGSADDCTGSCDGGLCGDEAWTLSGAVMGDDAPFTIGGWSSFGYHDESTGLFNSHPDQLVSHQNNLYLERVADGSEGFDFGFRGDIMYGADAQDTQAFGEPAPQNHWDTDWDNGIYGWALPQAYGEVAMGDLSVKVGKFYTLIGYEVVPANGNFFYSHSFTMYNSEPFTHTGALGTWSATDNTTVYGGWVAGWDTGYDRFADGDDSRGSAAIFGVGQKFGEVLTLTYIGLAGDMGVNGEGYNHSVVADFALSDKWQYVFQTDYVHLNFDSIGVNNFLFYTINDKLKLGGRAEWWKTNLLTGGPWESAYQVTAGVNIMPTANVTIRPEYRYQWGSGAITNLAGNSGQNAVVDDGIFGIDCIVTF